MLVLVLLMIRARWHGLRAITEKKVVISVNFRNTFIYDEYKMDVRWDQLPWHI